MKKIAIFTSGHSRGSNFLAIYNYIKDNDLPIEIAFVVVTDMTAPIIALARERAIPVYFTNNNSSLLTPHSTLNTLLIDACTKTPVDLIVLCGFMRKLSKTFFETIKTPVINIHPALLPKYGGKGMYGMAVHQAVFAAGERVSGATVHYVNEVYDAGAIICQEQCDISDCASPEEIAAKVLKVEHQIYPMTIEKMLKYEVLCNLC